MQIESSSESGGRTTLTLSRAISLCFWESFDWRDVGDAALVVHAVADDDFSDPASPPNEFKLSEDGATLEEDYVTLFTRSAAPTAAITDNGDHLDLLLDGGDPDGGMSNCGIKVADDGDESFDVDYFIGFEPVLNVGKYIGFFFFLCVDIAYSQNIPSFPPARRRGQGKHPPDDAVPVRQRQDRGNRGRAQDRHR